jgi:hypothetical protein
MNRKKVIQNNLWGKLGLKVDNVVQGKCTSNTDNVARRFFEDNLEVPMIT